MENELVQGYECLSSCLGYYINSENPGIAGSEICIFGGAMSVNFDEDTNTISTPVYNSNFVFLDKNHIPYEHGHCKEIEAKHFITECIFKGKQLVIKLSAEFLTYDRVFKQAENSTHYICITGEQDNDYLIADCYVPTRIPSFFSGPVSKDEILLAWGERDYEYIILEKTKLNKAKVITETINNAKKGIVEYCETGEKAVLKLMDYIHKSIAEPDFRKETLHINYQLKIYGFISTKIMLSQVLKNQGLCMDECRAYDELITKWQSICMHIVKLGITRKEEQYQKLLSMVQTIINDEKQILMKINTGCVCSLSQIQE